VRICYVLATHTHPHPHTHHPCWGLSWTIFMVHSCNCHTSTNNDQYQEQYQDHWGVVWRELLVHSCNCPLSSRASMPSIISIVLAVNILHPCCWEDYVLWRGVFLLRFWLVAHLNARAPQCTKSGTNSSPSSTGGGTQMSLTQSSHSSRAFFSSSIKGTFTAALKAHSPVCIKTTISPLKAKMQGTHNFLTHTS
jgi:hypothetical protein